LAGDEFSNAFSGMRQVLLDEGDALVEKRQRGQLLLNSMTGSGFGI